MASRRPRRRCSSTGPTPTASGGCSSAQIEAVETAIYLAEVAQQDRRRLGSRTRLRGGRRRGQPRPRRGLRSRWRPAAARRSSWRMLIAWQALQQGGQPADDRFTDALPRRRARHHDPATGCGSCCRATRTTTTASATWSRPTCWPRLRERDRRGHQLPRLRPARDPRGQRRQQDSPSRCSSRRRGRARSSRRRSRWSSRVCRALRRHAAEHRRPQRRGPPLLPAQASTTSTAPTVEQLKGEERKEAEERDEEARLWLTGLQSPSSASSASRRSTTCPRRPSSCSGSRLPGGTALPVGRHRLLARSTRSSAGLVKIPRVPVAGQRARRATGPTYRNLWLHIRDELPEEGPQAGAEPPATAAVCRSSSRARCTACTTTTTASYAALAGDERQRRRHAAGLHRRLQQHERVSKLVFDVRRRLRRSRSSTARPVARRQATSRCSATSTSGPLDSPGPRTILVDSAAARVRRGAERRVQDSSPRARSTSSRPSCASASRAATPTS